MPNLETLFQTITALPTDMSEIDPIEFGRMQADVHTLKQQMEEVRDDLKLLLEMANKGQGGLWMFRTMYVAAGGLLAWLIPHAFERIK